MNILAKYKRFEKTLENIATYKDLRKSIKQSFKFILKHNFTIFYYDEDNDKITISNQEDLNVVIQENEKFEIIVQEIDDTSELSDDSFQKLDKSVNESVNQFRKLSNGQANNDSNSPKIIQNQKQQEIEKELVKVKGANNQEEILEQKRERVIKEIQQTIEYISSQVLKIENDDTEKRLNEKIQNLQKPQFNEFSLAKELSQLQLIQQIEKAENNMINLDKIEREELKKNYNTLVKQVQNIASDRIKQQNAFVLENNDYAKTLQKIMQEINQTKLKNQRQLKQFNGLLNQYQKKLSQAENKKTNLDKIEYMNKEQLEIFLDNQIKEELKAKKQKQLEDQKKKEQLGNLQNQINEKEIQIQNDNIENSSEKD
ncbi:unnamed protein product [Paramecium sonneborni]|uniref:PB1 domain-containing protein n=1 Tax=Paramecium sonneborni TaxID=65129 RepID=A0A8S1LCI9_9CILI|nr:unnamed protein product [Paramecium sonneborni]